MLQHAAGLGQHHHATPPGWPSPPRVPLTVAPEHGFRIWLYDQGFVPVYSPVLGYRQPWLMAPVTSTAVVDSSRGAQLIPELLEGIHLRRR